MVETCDLETDGPCRRSSTLIYGKYVGPQRSEEIHIKLRATKVGVFSGDIDLWSNDADECATRRLQTEIVAAPEQ